MKKAQVLILLVLITLVVYYFSQTEKATQKPSNQSTLPPFQPSILPHQPPVINCPPASIMARNNQPNAAIMPSKNIEKKPAGKVFVSEDKVELNNSPKSPVANDYYRREIVNLLED